MALPNIEDGLSCGEYGENAGKDQRESRIPVDGVIDSPSPS